MSLLQVSTLQDPSVGTLSNKDASRRHNLREPIENNEYQERSPIDYDRSHHFRDGQGHLVQETPYHL
jgi:hypothetical protein